MTVAELLSSINAYPVPSKTIEAVALKRGLSASSSISVLDINTAALRLACADIRMWLSNAPSVSQGGQSYSFSESERKELRAKAKATYTECGNAEDRAVSLSFYGYKGSRL